MKLLSPETQLMQAGSMLQQALVASLLASICIPIFIQAASFDALTELGKERMVFQTDYGIIEMAFYPKVSHPATCTRENA